jgi:hypothetical protein
MIFFNGYVPIFAPKLIKEIKNTQSKKLAHTFFSLLFRKGQTIETFKEDIKVQLILQKNIIFN